MARFYDRNTGACILGVAEDPQRPPVTLSGEESDQQVGFGQAHISTLKASNGAEVSFGVLTTLAPFPMPVIGCGLIDSMNKWRCVFKLANSRQAFGGADSSHALAQALGLQARLVHPKAGPRFPGLQTGELDPAQLAESQREASGALAVARSASDDEFRQSLALLPQYVRDPTMRVPGGFYWSLTSHADQLGPRAEELADDLDQLQADSARVDIAQIIAALPDADFARIGPRVMVAADQSNGETLDHATTLLARLGDLGPSATPTLLEHIRPPGAAAAMIGLCRIGAPAAGDAAEAIVAFARSKPDYMSFNADAARAGYMAEMRLGRPDLAKIVLGMSPNGPKRLPAGADQISPNSPPNACRLNKFDNGLANVPWLQPDRVRR
jgi:hypothetical protein